MQPFSLLCFHRLDANGVTNTADRSAESDSRWKREARLEQVGGE